MQQPILIPTKRVMDNRGSLTKIFYGGTYKEQFYTISKKGVLRGMHMMKNPWQTDKLVYCIKGLVTDVCLDLRPGGHFGEYAVYTLAQGNALYIPKGYAHGFYAHKDTIMMYNTTNVYHPESDISIRWNSFGYNWGVKPTLSRRDRTAMKLKDYEPEEVLYEQTEE